MGVGWNDQERADVEDAIERYPVESGRCAALARVVSRVGRARDPQTRGLQITPRQGSAARFVVPKHPAPPRWGSHTFVETHAHAVDALTGVDGCAESIYLASHWQYTDALEVRAVDVDAIDAGIQEEP